MLCELKHDVVLEDSLGNHFRITVMILTARSRSDTTSGITGVHGNENTETHVEGYFLTEELKGFSLLSNRLCDREHLLRDHAQDLDRDTVELIEAGPHACLRQPTKEPAHDLVVQTS